jgi:hypothetical protein
VIRSFLGQRIDTGENGSRIHQRSRTVEEMSEARFGPVRLVPPRAWLR